MSTHPGEPISTRLERELADVQAEDGSIWSYVAESGGFESRTHPGVICRDAAAVAAHASPSGAVWQAPINHEEEN